MVRHVGDPSGRIAGPAGAGTISDVDDFRAADEFLPLRDLLAEEGFEELSETPYH
jgi:hypothetical protein